MTAVSPLDRVLNALHDKGSKVRSSGAGFMAQCPNHPDEHESLSVSIGDDGRVLLHDHAGCAFKDIVDALGLVPAELFVATAAPRGRGLNGARKPTPAAKPNPKPATFYRSAIDCARALASYRHGELVDHYVYHRGGVDVGMVARVLLPDGSKEMPQGRCDEARWTPRGMDKPYPLFGVDDLAADVDVPIQLHEGEKKALLARSLGFCATSCAMGAGKAKHSDLSPLAGRVAHLFGDKDEPGRAHVADLAARAHACGAASVWVVTLPGLPEGGDLCDFVNSRRKRGASDEQIADDIREAIATATEVAAPVSTAPSAAESGAAAGDDEDDDEPLTDVTNARLLVDRRGAWLRHCASLGWLEWDSSRWVPCPNDEQLQHAVAVIEEFYAEAVGNLKQTVSELKDAMKADASDEAIKALKRELSRLSRIKKHAVESQKVSRLQAMLKLAASDPRITADAAAFDADPWLLNCTNGTVDLRTGELRDHREEDLLTQMAGASYDPHADCPLWKQTLAEVFAGEDSDEIISYVQRAAGYSATGLTREEVFFLLHGDGRNGKGVVAEALHRALGSYARNAPMSLFLEARNDGSKRFAVAEFRGVRMTVASEATEGRAFDLATIKGWTGGDTRYAEKKGRDPFEYRPTDKPWLLVNDKPKVKSWDIAFEERLRLVPFEHSFTGSRADKTRKLRLRAEISGILNWIVQGCLAWQKQGLMPPTRGRAAADEYKRESTRADEFISERLIRIAGMTVAQSDVYAAYRDWSRHRDHPTVPEQRFGTYLDAAGYERRKVRRGQVVVNAALRHDDPPSTVRDDGDDGDALLSQPPISNSESSLRDRVGTASPSSPSSHGTAADGRRASVDDGLPEQPGGRRRP